MDEQSAYKASKGKIQDLERVEPDCKQIRQTLQKNHDRLWLSCGKTDLPYHCLNENGDFTEVNQFWLHALGYSREEVIGKSFIEFLHLDSKDHFRKIFPRLKSFDEILGLELQMVKKSGSLIFVLFHCKIEHDCHENFQLAHFVFQDITRRKYMENELLENEEKFRLAMESMKDPAYICSLDYHINYLNPAMIKKIGHDALGEICHMSIYNNGQKCPWCVLDKVIHGKQIEYEKIDSENDRFYSITNFPLNIARGNIFKLTIFRDITHYKKAEQQLKKSRQKYQSLAHMLHMMCDFLPDMIWAKDLEKRYIFANKSFCHNFLNTDDTEEPIGKTDLFFAERELARHPNNPDWYTFGELCQNSDTIVMEKGIPMQFDEFGKVNGKSFCFDVRKAPFLDETGKIIGTVGSARDVTAARKMEEKLKKLNKNLEKMVKKRTASLEDLNTALRVLLKQREEEKKQINANIYASFKSIIQPLLDQLKNNPELKNNKEILDILESSIKDMAIPFSKKLADPLVGLTPTEIQVASLVKNGKTNKEIAQILNKSIRAIASHRDNIRQKLHLKNKKINLRSYLLSLD